jgi:hypothetical protein
MEWFDLTWGGNQEPGGILELQESRKLPSLALELHILRPA